MILRLCKEKLLHRIREFALELLELNVDCLLEEMNKHLGKREFRPVFHCALLLLVWVLLDAHFVVLRSASFEVQFFLWISFVHGEKLRLLFTSIILRVRLFVVVCLVKHWVRHSGSLLLLLNFQLRDQEVGVDVLHYRKQELCVFEQVVVKRYGFFVVYFDDVHVVDQSILMLFLVLNCSTQDWALLAISIVGFVSWFFEK